MKRPAEIIAQNKENARLAHADRIRKARAFMLVFGVDGERSDAQETVWREVMAMCGVDQTSFRYDQSGRLDVHAVLAGEGSRLVAIRIRQFIADGMKPPVFETQ